MAKHREYAHVANNRSEMFDRMHHIASPGLTLGANHGRAFYNPPQSFAQITRTAHEWDAKPVLVHMVGLVGRGEEYRFINVINDEFLKDLGFGKMSDPALGHHRHGHGAHDLPDFFGRRHAGHAA